LIFIVNLGVKVTTFCFLDQVFLIIRPTMCNIEQNRENLSTEIQNWSKIKYLNFEIHLWLWGELWGEFLINYIHHIIAIISYGDYMVQFLAKLVKPSRIYHKLKYLTFDFDFWPWCQGHRILFFSINPFVLLCWGIL